MISIFVSLMQGIIKMYWKLVMVLHSALDRDKKIFIKYLYRGATKGGAPICFGVRGVVVINLGVIDYIFNQNF